MKGWPKDGKANRVVDVVDEAADAGKEDSVPPDVGDVGGCRSWPFADEYRPPLLCAVGMIPA